MRASLVFEFSQVFFTLQHEHLQKRCIVSSATADTGAAIGGSQLASAALAHVVLQNLPHMRKRRTGAGQGRHQQNRELVCGKAKHKSSPV
jgi:hypothetical protein